MSTLVLRNTKGSALTFTELDTNFSNLNNDKADVGDIIGSDSTGSGQINASNLGSADARTHAASAIDFDSYVSSGDISTLMNTAYPSALTANQRAAIELVIRPLYSMLSVLLKNLQDQNIA